MEYLPGFAPLAGRYDGFVLDLWGVIHDGVNAFPRAVDCLNGCAKGRAHLLLSNVPRPNAAAQATMQRIGTPDDLYTDILTSGEAVRPARCSGPARPVVGGAWPARLSTWGPERDRC